MQGNGENEVSGPVSGMISPAILNVPIKRNAALRRRKLANGGVYIRSEEGDRRRWCLKAERETKEEVPKSRMTALDVSAKVKVRKERWCACTV